MRAYEIIVLEVNVEVSAHFVSIPIFLISCSLEAKVESSRVNGAGCASTYGCMNYHDVSSRVQNENFKKHAFFLIISQMILVISSPSISAHRDRLLVYRAPLHCNSAAAMYVS